MTLEQSDLFPRLRAAAGEDWTRYTDHEFVRALTRGDLAEASFRHYLQQDYVFLKHFARAWALAAFKADNLADMRAATEVLDGLLNHEMALHVDLCRRWGIEAEALERTPEARANMAYTRYVIERGLAGDLLELLVALAPCVIGYAEIGAARHAEAGAALADHPYREWLETYAGDEFQGLAGSVAAQMDRLAERHMAPTRFPELAATFTAATRLEIGFWDMGLQQTL
ncbi:thiaminase II [Sediminicurvatus halobius]|uniref:Aminopyrimidine aminohydrolase n=1 Tax=Sediminicurvatus halobius TaxID=2182432 RepID=A0A2U2N6D9_9GAMM|nr:thiaminase II [Spiribacter halobius]PWG64673.1 thiaminase II [Spiribacter halobius]UEX79002.1 thiaminase II [Spiribacter halobius]